MQAAGQGEEKGTCFRTTPSLIIIGVRLHALVALVLPRFPMPVLSHFNNCSVTQSYRLVGIREGNAQPLVFFGLR